MTDTPTALDQALVRRLVLAKQLYLHGRTHSLLISPLDKMIAVHNFHNALEIVLRSIMLSYNIRTEKQLNIEFETMLNDISNAKAVKDKGLQLPYRQELRNLNLLRNMVQHHGIEPETSMMEDWRVFSSQFLKRTYLDFFDIQFNRLSTIAFVKDPDIKDLLQAAQDQINQESWIKATVLSKVAFEAASSALYHFLPSEGTNSSFFVTASLRHDESPSMQNAIESIYNRIRESELFSAVVSSGVAVADYKRLEKSTPHVMFTIGGKPALQARTTSAFDDEESARWVFEFCSTTILNWQSMGMEPTLTLLHPEGLRAWLKEYVA